MSSLLYGKGQLGFCRGAFLVGPGDSYSSEFRSSLSERIRKIPPFIRFTLTMKLFLLLFNCTQRSRLQLWTPKGVKGEDYLTLVLVLHQCK
jgi:hypothetical protein